MKRTEPIGERSGEGLSNVHKRAVYCGHTHAADLTHLMDRLPTTLPFSGKAFAYVCEKNTVPSFP